jgi:hypothetical protein
MIPSTSTMLLPHFVGYIVRADRGDPSVGSHTQLVTTSSIIYVLGTRIVVASIILTERLSILLGSARSHSRFNTA